MQAGSLEFLRLRAEADIDPLCIHVPGLALVAEGIDSSSRAESSLWMDFGDNSYLDSVVRPSVPDKPWGKIVTAAQSAGLRATLDPCATESTPRAKRYCSRSWEPESEAMDAFLVRNWAQSRCSSWGAIHREPVYAFPLSGLIKTAARKAVADAVLCIHLVPVAVTAPCWHELVVLRPKPDTDTPSADHAAPCAVLCESRLKSHTNNSIPAALRKPS